MCQLLSILVQRVGVGYTYKVLVHAKATNDNNLRHRRTGGLIQFLLQNVQKIHELELWYAYFMLLLRWFILHSLFYDFPKKQCHVGFILLKRSVAMLLLCLSIYFTVFWCYVYQFVYSSLRKNWYVTLILPNGSIFSTVSLNYLIL